MSVTTNTFCASGMHLPNGSYSTFGGNDAVSIGASFSHRLCLEAHAPVRIWLAVVADLRRRLWRL